MLLNILTLFAFAASGRCLQRGIDEQASCLSSTCAKTNFLGGHTYVYEYRVRIHSENNRDGAVYHRNLTTINANVEISADNSCNLFLKVYDVVFKGEDVVDEGIASELMSNELIFHYEEGRVTDICISKSDTNQIAYIKLGILSALQYILKDEYGTYYELNADVTGECTNAINVSESEGWTVVRRQTDSDRCLYRTGFHSQSQFLYESLYPSTMKFIKNNAKCRHVLGKTGQPILIACREHYAIDPFMNGNNVKVTVRQHLDLDCIIVKDTVERSDNTDDYESMDYRYPSFDSESSSIDLIKSSIDMIKLYNYNKNEEVHRNLTKLLAMATFDDMQYVYESCDDEEKRDMREILANVLTEDVFEMMVRLYEEDSISIDELKLYLSLLPFIKQPNGKAFEIVQPLFEIDGLRPSVDLGISGLIYNYCNFNEECTDVDEIKALIELIEQPLGMRYTPKLIDPLTIALMCIGNMGFTFSYSAIEQILKDKNIPIKLRNAAVEAYRRMPCEFASRDSLLESFSDQDDDPVFRLKAYLGVMQCPTNDFVRRINGVLKSEDVDLVTHNVWKHLTELQNSSATFTDNLTNILIDRDVHLKHRMNYNEKLLSYYNLFYSETDDNVSIDERVNTEFDDLNVRSYVQMFGEKFDIFSIRANVKDLVNVLDAKLKYSTCKRLSDVDDDDVDDERRDFVTLRLLGTDVFYSNSTDLDGFLERLILSRKPLQFRRKIEVVDAFHYVQTIVGVRLKISVNAEIDFEANSMFRVNYKDLSECRLDVEGRSMIKMSSTVSSSIRVDLPIEIGVDNEDNFEIDTTLEHKIERSKRGDIYIISN